LHLNGENAHNYFLQTITELGLIGFTLFTIVVIRPLFQLNNKRLVMPALICLGSIFLANVYSHSMLVRENLLTAMMVLALIYAWMYEENSAINPALAKNLFVDSNNCASRLIPKTDRYKLHRLLALSAMVVAVATETYFSFKDFPFTEDPQCVKLRPIDADGWTSGHASLSIPAGSKGVKLTIEHANPYLAQNPISVKLSIRLPDKGTSAVLDYTVETHLRQSIELMFPLDSLPDSSLGQLELRVSRCFIPRNLAMNSDGRRLGIRISSVDWL
jgi:hypothetical protein